MDLFNRRPNAPLSNWSVAALGVTAIAFVEAVYLATVVIPGNQNWSLGMDYRFYRDVGVRWLADGSFYQAHQLVGAYQVGLMVDVLYPPPALLLFVALTVLPAVLWWAVPIAVLAFVLSMLRPEPRAQFVMALALAWPGTIGAYLFGDTDIWAAAVVAAGVYWGWPAAFLVLKPVYLPFAIFAIRRRLFWIALGAGVLISLAMLPLWADYLRAMQYARVSLTYSVSSIPLLLIPVVAWLGRDRVSRRQTQTGGATESIRIAAGHL